MDKFLEDIKQAIVNKQWISEERYPTPKTDSETIFLSHETEQYKVTCSISGHYTQDSYEVSVVDLSGSFYAARHEGYEYCVERFFIKVEKAIEDNVTRNILLGPMGWPVVRFTLTSKLPKLFGVNSGNTKSDIAFTKATNKTIKRAYLEDNKLKLDFTDGTGLMLYDDDHQCCEERWTSTDDDLDNFCDSKLYKVEVKEGPTVDDNETDKYETYYHDTAFLDVTTSKGVFTLVTHNSHNGYYGGFDLVCEFIEVRN